MNQFPSCAIRFSLSDGMCCSNKHTMAYEYFRRPPPSGLLVEFALEGTNEEIIGITGDPNEKFVIVRTANGQINIDPRKKEPNGSAAMTGHLDRLRRKYIRFELDLKTGKGLIERID